MISLLILTRGRFGVTARCMRSLAPILAREDVEWVVLHNGGEEPLGLWWLKVAQQYPQVRVVLQDNNLGVAGGRQKLLGLARGEYLVILDNDVEAVRAGWLDRLLWPLDHVEGVGLCGPGGNWITPGWEWYDPVYPGYVGYVDTVAGYCQAFKRDVLWQGVALDQAFNPYWHEDTDMAMQIAALGQTVWCTGDIGIRHIFAGTGDDGRGQDKQRYLASKWAGRGLARFERAAV